MSDYVNNPMSKGIGDMVKVGKGLDTPLKLDANVLPNLNERPSVNATTNAADLYKGASGFAPGVGRMPVLPTSIYKSLGLEPSPDGFKEENKGINPLKINSANVHKFISAKTETDEKNKKKAGDLAFGDNAQRITKHADNTANSIYSRETNIDHKAYQDYFGGFGININTDIDEVRAQNQSGWEQAGRGTARFLGTTAQAFVEPFVNFAGLFAWGGTGFQKFSIVFDNEVTRGMDNLNDMLRESMPIYETKAQRESTAFSAENLTSGAFWFDRVLNGAAFTVGTLLNAYATAGLGTVIKGAATSAKLAQQIGKAYSVMRGMDKVEDVANALRSITNTGRVGEALGAVKNFSKGAGKWGVSLMSASAEGGVEAREMKRELMPILQAKIDRGELTKEEADSQLEWAMFKLYSANVAVVGFSNHMQYAGLIFRGGRAGANAGNVGWRKILKEGVKTNTVVPGGRFTRMLLNKAGEATRLSKTVAALTYGMPLVKGIATETGEEATQFIASKAMIDYYSLNGSRNFVDAVTGTWDSAGVGVHELFSKKEGLESMLIGGMMGIVGGGRGIIENNQKTKRNKEIASHYNNKIYGKDGQMIKAMTHMGEVIITNQASVNHENYKGKAKDDAVLEALDNHHTASMAQYGVETGTLDIQKEYLDEVAAMESEEFAVNFPTLASMTKEERSLMISSAKEALDKNAKTYNDIKRDFSHLDDDLRNSVYFLASFHGNTQDIYNKKIEYLKQQGIDVAQARAEALAEYESERADAYAKYKEAQKEKGGAYKSYVAFSKEYDEAQEIEVPVRTIKDGKAVIETTIAKGNKAMILAKRANEIADTYFQREDGKVLNEALYSDFLDTVQLEKSLNQTQAMIADYHNSKKVEELTKVYNDNLSKTAKANIDSAVGKPHSTVMSKLNKVGKKTSKEDFDKNIKEAEDLQDVLTKEIAKRIEIINTPNVDPKLEKIATLELETLMAYMNTLNKATVKAKANSSHGSKPAQPSQPAENPTILTQAEAKTKEEEDIALMNENYERHGAAILNSVGNALKALGDKIKQQFPSNVPNDIQNEYEALEHQYNTILVKAEEFKTKMKPDAHSDIDVFNATFKDVRSNIDDLNVSILNLTSKVNNAVNVLESLGIEKYIVELEKKYNELLANAAQRFDSLIDIAIREGLNDTIEARIKELEHNIAKLDELINTGIAKLDTKKAEAKIDKIAKAIVDDLNLINGHLNELTNLAKVENKDSVAVPDIKAKKFNIEKEKQEKLKNVLRNTPKPDGSIIDEDFNVDDMKDHLGAISVSAIQRRYMVGYNYASLIRDKINQINAEYNAASNPQPSINSNPTSTPTTVDDDIQKPDDIETVDDIDPGIIAEEIKSTSDVTAGINVLPEIVDQIEGDTTQNKINNVFSMLQGMIDSNSDSVSFSVRASDNTTTSKPLTKHQLLEVLFGDGTTNNKGLFYNHLIEKGHNSKSLNAIYSNPINFMAEVESLWSGHTKAKLDNGYFNVFLSQFILINSNRFNNVPIITFKEFRQFIDTDGVPYITSDLNTKAKDLNQDLENKDTERKAKDPAVLVRANRDTRENNEILERIVDIEEVYTGAAAHVEVANMTMTVDGKTITTDSIVTAIREGRINEIPIEVIDSLPLNALNSKGELIGYLNTASDLRDNKNDIQKYIAGFKNVSNPNAAKEGAAAELRIATLAYEIERARDLRLKSLFYLALTPDAKTIPTTIVHRGTGYSETTPNALYVSDAIKQEGTIMLVAKPNKLDMITSLYLDNDTPFAGKIHNLNHTTQLVNGITYIAFPVNKVTNSEGKLVTEYMIMPMQSTLIGNAKQGFMNEDNRQGVDEDGKPISPAKSGQVVEKKKNGNTVIDNSNTFGEQVKHSIVTAVKMLMKLKKNEAFNEIETQFKEALSGKFNMESEEGIQDYINQLTYTYNNDPVEFTYAEGNRITVLDILKKDRIKEGNVSVIRASQNYIEFGTRKNGVISVVSFYMGEEGIKMSSYDVNTTTDNVKVYNSVYENDDAISQFIYDHLDTAFLRVDLNNLNKKGKYELPLVKLGYADKASKTKDDNTVALIQPIKVVGVDPKGISFDSYEEYARNVLRSDIKSAYINGKYYYSAMPAVMIDDKSIDADIRGKKVNGKTFEDFKASFKSNNATVILNSRYSHTDIANATASNANPDNNSFVALFNAIKVRLAIDFDAVTTNNKGEIIITKGNEVTRIYMGNVEKRYVVGKNSKVDTKKVNKIVEDIVRELNKPFNGTERIIGLYSSTVKVDSPIVTKADSPAAPTAGSTQTETVAKTEVEINTIDAGVKESLTGEQLAIFASIDVLIGNPAIESAIPLFVNRLVSLDKNNLTPEDYAGIVRDYIARKTTAIIDGNSTGTFSIRVLNAAAVEEEASKRQDVLDAISSSPAFVRDNEGKISYNTFKTLNRAQSVADRLNERLQETPFYAKVVDISTKNFQNVYQVVIGDESDVFDLFGEDHVDLVRAINNNKGFIPFVSPVVQLNTIRNIGHAVFDRLIKNKNKKGTLSEVIEEYAARWRKKIEDLSSIKETLTLMGSDSQLVDNFDREITMYQSLIDNKKVLADMVTTELMSSSMISFKTKDGNIVAKESEAFLSKGESEEDSVDKNEEDIDEDDEDFTDRVLNEELEEDDKESNNWDDGNLNVDHRNTASVIIKQFLSGLKMVRFNSKGEAVVVTDPSGADMLVGYNDAYSLIMKYLMDKPRSFEQMLTVLRDNVNEQPIFQQIIDRLENESRDPYSTIPNMFVELAQKRRLEMKYLWLASSHKGNGSYYNKIGDSNKANIKNVVMNQWQNQLIYSKFSTIREDGSVIINGEALLKHQTDHKIAGVPIKKLLVATGNAKATVDSVNKAIDAFNKEYKDKDNKWFKPISNIKTNEEIAAVGLAISNQIKDYIESYTAPTGITFSIDTINSMIRTTANSRNVQGVFELFLKRDANHFKLLLEKIAGLGVDIDLASANLHAYVKSQISIFLKQESMFNVGVSPDTFKDRDSKTVNTIAMFKYIDERLIRLTDASNPLLSELRQTAFAKKSWFLDYIKSVVDSNSAIEAHRKVQSENQTEEGGLSFNETTKLKIHTADSIVYQDSKGKTVSVKVDKAERGDVELFNLFNYYNKGNDNGVFMYPALSDGKLMQLIEMTKFKPVFQGTGDSIELSETDYNRLFEYIVEPEIDRIVTASKLIEKGVLPSVDQLKEGSQRFILNSYLDGLLDGKNGRIKPNRSELIKNAKPLFKEFINASIKERLDIWNQYGIVKGNFMNYQDNASVKDKGVAVTNNAKRTAIEFEVNNLLLYVGVNQAFVGDTGAYWSKNLDNTIANISKRLAGHRGPGAIGANYATNETFSVIVAEDVHVDSEAINFIPDAFKKDYSKDKMTTTDGQEFTSLYEDLYTRMQHGDNIPPILFNLLFGGENSIMYKAYTRMFVNGEEDFNYDEIIEKELAKHDKLNPTKPSVKDMYNKFVNQPVKPMYYNTKIVTVGSTKMDIPFYIKSSSFALRPSLTQGFGIDAVRKAMDYSTFLYMQEAIEIEKKNPVDKEAQLAKAKQKMISRYSYASAIKVGGTSNADKVKLLKLEYGKGGFKNNLATFEASKVVYPREGFRIQQVIPFNYNKQKINVGTQERKLLFNGFIDIEDLKALKADYDTAYDKLYKTGYDQLMSELTKEDGELDYNKLSNILIKEGLSRKYDDNDIAELLVNSKGDGLESKLFFHRRDKAIESLILSIVNNRVNKMKFPGRSYVLGTEAGFFDRLGKGKGTKIKEEIPVGANIIFTSKWKGELKAHGFIAKVQINENIGVGDYIPHDMVETLDSSMYEYQPDQVILPNFIRNNKGKVINLREGFDGIKGKYIYLDQTTGTIRLDESKFDTDILRLFGFRIPTQGHSSMASMEVVGFSDDRVGELVIAPADFVARMGSDFDIDKLYVYRYAIKAEMINPKATAIINNIKKVINDHLGENEAKDVYAKLNDFFEIRNDRFNSPEFKERIISNIENSIKERVEFSSMANLDKVVEDVTKFINESDSDTLIELNASHYKDLETSDYISRIAKGAITKSNVDFDNSFATILGLEGNVNSIVSFRRDITELFKELKAVKETNAFKFSKNNEDKYGTINEIIGIHHKVFAHPSTKVQKSITSPLSYGFFNQSYQPAESVSAKFDKLKAGRSNYYLGEFIEDLYGNNKQIESPLTSKYQVDFYFKGKMGKDGIARFSSRSVINAVLQQASFKDRAIQLFVKGDKGMVPYTTKIGGAEFKNENLGSNKTLNGKGFTIADVISWYQSTAVDNAKLNKLHKMNINSETIEVVDLMNQMGFEEETIWFINQPIIRRYAELMKNQQALIAKSDNGRKTALDIVKEEFHADKIIGKKKVSLSDNPLYNGYKESVANMADNIEKYSEMKDVEGSLTAEQNRYFGEQLAILTEFNYMKTKPAAHFKHMAQLLNVDSKGLGSSVASVYKKKQLIASFLGIELGDKASTKATIADHFTNIDSILGAVKTNEQIQSMVDNNEDVSDYIEILDGIFIKPEGVVGNAIVRNIHAFDKLFGKEFIQFSDKFEDAKSELIKTVGEDQAYNLDDTVISEKLITAYKKYAHANALASLGINLEDEYNRLLVDEWRTEKGEKLGEFIRINEKASLSTVILDIQKTKHSNNTLIASLTAQPSKGKTYASVLFNNLDGGSDNNAKVLAAMYDLVNSNPVLLEQHPVTKQSYTGRDLIKDLFIYSEITGGIQRFGELVKFMPHELKKMIGFNDSLNEVIENKPINNKAFLFQFIQHEPSFARKIVLEKGEKGIINLTKIDRVEKEIDGKPHISYMPVNYNGAGSIGYVMIHPSFKEGKFFKVNDEPFIPLMVSKKYTKDGVTKLSLFKLVLNGDGHSKHISANDMIDNSAASPLMINGCYVYERVDELGTGTKTEYDPTLSIVGTKRSATNKEVRSNYHTAEELLDAAYDKSGRNTDFIFRNYGPRAIGNALQKAADNTNLNPVARFFAATLKNNNFHNGIVVMSRAELLSKDTTDNPTLEAAKQVALSPGGKSNPMYYQENHSKDSDKDRHYIIVNEEVENSAGTSVQVVLKDFIHEMIHAATLNHKATPINGEPFRVFEESGKKLVNSAVDYLRKNPTSEMKEEGMTIDKIIKGFELMVNSSNSAERNEFFNKWGNYYGLLNFKEFYAEMGSNTVFIEMMGKIPYNESLADSKVIKVAKGHSMVGDSIVAAFIKYAAKLINDLLYLFHKTTGAPKIKLKESSIASYAVAELVVGIKTHSKAKLGREYKLYTDSKGQPVPNTVEESDFVANKSLNDKIKDLKLKDANDSIADVPGLFDNNGEQDVYGEEPKGVTQSTVIDGEVVELASADDVNNMFEEVAGLGSSFSIPSAPSILGDIFERVNDERVIASEYNASSNNNRVSSDKVDEILLGLNKEGRLDFSCKL